MSLRREVFIPAADAVSRLQNVLSGLGDLSVEDRVIGKDQQEAAAILARVQVVGGETTVKAISAYLLEHASAYLDLMFERAPLMQIKGHVDVVQHAIDSALAEQTRWTQEMQRANVEGKMTPQLWDVLKGNFDVATKQFNDKSAERQSLLLELGRRQLTLLEHALHKMRALAKMLPPMLLAVRDELEFSIDKEAYLQLVEEADKRSAKLSEEMLSRLAAHVEQSVRGTR